jgi:predicted transglutaminase-like cysteine proteinase
MAVLNKFSPVFCVLAALFAGGTSAQAAGWMQTREAVPPPLGFVSYCAQNLETCRVKFQDARQVSMDTRHWAALNAVQQSVNAAIRSVPDSQSTGSEEQWSLGEKGIGDCEDYALRKKQMLIREGFPQESLLLTTAVTEKGEKHVVLTVVTDKGDYILDNRYAKPMAWNDLAYNWIARQDPLNPLIWRKAIGGDSSRMASLGQGQNTPR